MPVSLKELSDRATPGDVTVHEGQPCNHGDDGGGGFTLCFGGLRRTGSGPVIYRFGYAEDIWEDHFPDAYAEAKANIGLIARLWNAYRSGQLHDATALAEAEARGRRQGLEEAAQIAREIDEVEGCDRGCASRTILKTLRSLATTPAETQKPETGESGHG